MKTDDNLVLRLITIKFVHPEYFSPTARFYSETNIKQRRWWQLYKGEKKPTNKELSSLVKHLKVSDKELNGWLQLELFENGI